jgi:hypothetical protein
MRLVIVFLIVSSFAAGAAYKQVQISDTEFVLSVPSAWKKLAPDCENLKLHMRALHSGGKYSDFDVFIKDKGRTSRTRWLGHYKRENLPFLYGRHRVASEEAIKAGPFEGTLFHVLDLEANAEHGLLEALVFADDSVLFIRYTYNLSSADRAGETMDRILASFMNSDDAKQKAWLDYEEGYTIGLEKFGLFLELPEGWIPRKAHRRAAEVEVSLPSGGCLKVITSRKVSSGMDGLRELACKCKPCLHLPAKMEPTAFGTTRDKAFCCTCELSECELCLDCTLGLHGTGGYALILESQNPTERELLKKISARAVLVVSRDVNAMRREFQDIFRKGMKENDIERIRAALARLVLFSGNDGVATTIGLGLDGPEEIQMACVEALGRMSSRKAAALLEKASKSRRVSPDVRNACMER